MKALNLASAALAAASLVVLAITYRQDVSAAPRADDVPEAVATVREGARALVDQQTVALKRAELEIDDKTKTVYYSLGSVNPDALNLDADDPYRIVFARQIQAESIKRAFRAAAVNGLAWQQPVARIESILAEIVLEIRKGSDSKKANDYAESRLPELDKELDALRSLLVAYAKSRGYVLKRTDRAPASDTFTVEVSTEPKGGTVRVMPALKHIQCEKLNMCGDAASWPWRQLVSDTESLVGEYYFVATWPDGKRNEGLISVRNASPITLKPK